MAAVSTEDAGIGSSLEVALGDLDQQCLLGESLAEWRSSEQLENGIPSTSPPYWDSDDEDDRGLKPPELYGKYTWKIDKFSQINKRELRSNAFEVGGYKWYILIYPQGCDVCNHLSLFLCVANHDKLLPAGWSHFAQFTIAVVNKDPKKSKYSDTLHRFWKKEHDWGWKKFMELSKVFDGFIDADTLIIKAQVQVIRERADRPFRCLDCQYRRELIRVYLSNVEQICRRFVEERRSKLGKLIEDKARWSSFRAFWLSMDQSSRRLITQEKTESILKVVVKQFFIEKEVTSTLVMDSLYSGLKALEAPCKGKKAKSKHLDSEELSIPIIKMERDMFMLVDDVLPLLERAVMEPLPPKDEKGPQNRMKDGATGEESNKDSIERDERRLTELGRRTIEIFILAHIFSKIEVAYQEAVALKKQEELIREEEAAWLAESEHKLRRGSVDKEKKSKKKQGKQKRNNRKAKDKGKDEKLSSIVQAADMDQDSFIAKNKDFIVCKEEGTALEKSFPAEDVSDVSDSADGAPERFHLDSEERDVNPVNWDTDNSEAQLATEASSSGISGITSMPNGTQGKKPLVLDDTSSTSSSDSVPSVILNMPNASNPHHQKDKKSSSRRGRNLQGKKINDSMGWTIEENRQPSETGQGAENPKVATRTSMGLEAVPSAVTTHPSREMILDTVDMRVKDDGASCMQRNLCIKEAEPSGEAAAGLKLPSRSPSKEASSIPAHKSVSKVDIASSSSPVGKKSSWSGSPGKSYVPLISAKSAENLGTSELDSQNSVTPRVMEKTSDSQKLQMDQVVSCTTGKLAAPVPVVSRPYSAPLIPSSKVAVSTVQTVPASPTFSRSSSAACSLGPDSPASAAQSYVPLSYRNAIMGGPMNGSSFVSSYHQNNHSTSSVANSSVQYSQAASAAPLYSQFGSDRMEMKRPTTLSSFGMASHHDMLPTARTLWTDTLQRDGSSRNLSGDIASESGDMRSFDLYSTYRSRSSQDNTSSATPSRRQTHVSADEFPHLDIINDLLDDENGGVSNSCSLSDSDCHGFRNAHSRSSAAAAAHLMNENQLYSNFPLDTTSPGPSAAGVCRFERTRSFSNERFQYSGYPPAMGTSQEAMGHHGCSPRPHYNNGQVPVLVPPGQWQMGGGAGAERGGGAQFLNGRSSDNDGYLYRLMEYQNLSSNGFPVYRPSNGM
ncbi:hypothetical protein M569_02868 [Genlisea aurea]|uniref:MATH domain-containing protein n=1 Tax=Genlisea aurea TaxID=192259 RepID=S8E7T0_9LAMI|nr:hypothetical protein M569_02868 [Genlisea aurea]